MNAITVFLKTKMQSVHQSMTTQSHLKRQPMADWPLQKSLQVDSSLILAVLRSAA